MTCSLLHGSLRRISYTVRKLQARIEKMLYHKQPSDERLPQALSLPLRPQSHQSPPPQPHLPNPSSTNVNAAACTRVIKSNATTIAQIQRLKNKDIAIPPYLSSSYFSESILSCSGHKSESQDIFYWSKPGSFHSSNVFRNLGS